MKTYRIILGSLQLFIAIGAIPAALGFLADPSGKGMGTSTAMLAHSPFTTFLIPGLFLLVVNGLGNVLGSVLSFMNNRMAGKAGLLLGVVLCLWMLFQVYWIGLTSFLQPCFFVVGVTELFLGWKLMKRPGRGHNKSGIC